MQSIVWKRIKDYPNYFIGETGHIFSLNRGRILKNKTNSEGYESVKLYNVNGVKDFRINRLVLMEFIGNPLSQNMEANHLDGQKNNNNLFNLEWATPSENMQHRYNVLGHHGSAKGKFGKDNPSSKKIHQIKDGLIIKTWDSLSDAKRSGEFTIGGISNVISGKQKTYRGYEWKLA